jgi:hypothetical protein
MGDEIPIEFRITNHGTNDYKYADRTYDRSGRMDEYMLTAKDESGKIIPDPRKNFKGGWFGGGLFGYQLLKPGQSFTKTIPLNRWALIKKPGHYVVMGTYMENSFSTNILTSSSDPITVTVLPRTEKEMDEYIGSLTNEIASLSPGQIYPYGHYKSGETGPSPELNGLLMKLMYTCSPQIIPALLSTMYLPGHGGFWESEALLFYVPRSDEIKRKIIAEAGKRGLADGMQFILSQYGCNREDFQPLIERSLATDSPQSWVAGTQAAQEFGNDAFNPRLIALATEPQNVARTQAIYALAENRTDDGVRALKTLLNDPDPKIQETTAQAIRTAYLYRGNCQGRPLNPEDFDEKYRRPEPEK